jgi:hypothetical protein
MHKTVFQEMESSSSRGAQYKKWLKLLLKISVTVFCFWYLSTKINLTKTIQSLATANWLLLLLATLLYSLSKLISATRLNLYFQNIKIHLSGWENLKLYWLGMFYNLFLPGSIGGDAYKVIFLNKRLQAPYKKTAAAVLLDRFSGLLGLGIVLACFGAIVFVGYIQILLVFGCIAAIVAYYYLVKLFFNDFLPSFFSTLLLGTAVQVVQVICVYCILASLGLSADRRWILIFLVASVVAVLPISMGGGLGTRELVFAEGARHFHLDPEQGITISLLFFLCNVLSCVAGAFYVFTDPLATATRKVQEST